MARKPRRMPPEKPANAKQSIKNIFSLLTGYKLKLSLTVICGIISTVFSVISPLLIGFATTAIFDGINSGNMDLNHIINLLIAIVILYIISAVFSYLQSYLLLDITTDISYNLRKDLIEKITHLSMGDLDINTRGDILSRITNDVDSLQTGIVQTFNQLLTGVITIVGVTVMMLSINLWLTLTTIVLVPIAFLIITYITKFSQDYYLKQLRYRGNLNGQIEESFTGHEIIRSFNQEKESMRIFEEENENWYEQEWKSKFFSSLSGPFLHFISNLQYVIISVLGAVLVLQKAISVGDILAFIQYSKNFTTPIEQITRIMNMIQTAMAASERIFEFLEIKVEENPSKEQINALNDEISFENVNFGYSDEDLVIKDLSFKVKKGEKIAIVGETGAGKTTIVKLLMRFYDLNSGAIKIDGVNINNYDKHSVRSLVGMVLQDTWLFNDTIYNNIRYGKLDATKEEVINASIEAHADHFIRQIPEGYESELNEDADNISHGQKQLLTIARTILSNKQILILDEATSSVDTRTEKIIQEAMDKLMKDRTSFIIAHRLSTVRNADKIIVIEDGHIIEQGSHEELLEQKGYYYNTLNAQKKGEYHMNGENNLDENLKEHINQFNTNQVNNQLLFHKFIMINEILDKRNKKQNPEMKSITKGQGRLIGFLKRKDGFSTKELSEILNISVTSLNETLNKLEQQNFIRKVPSPKDKRVLLVELTEEGRAIEFKNHEDIDIFDTLSKEEKENLNEYLNRLTIALHNKFKEENPEKYEKIIKHRKEIFEKYFKEYNPNEEWMQFMNCNKKK